MSSEVKQMNDDWYQQCEERVKHIRIKEFHRLENLYAKIRKKVTESLSHRVTEFFILGVLVSWRLGVFIETKNLRTLRF